MFYIFHGEEEFGRSEELAGLRAQMAGGDEAMAQLNTSLLDGKRTTMGELRHACDSIPFMADRRLVIVNGLLGRLPPGGTAKGQKPPRPEDSASSRALLDDLAAYLPNLPPTTRLVFLEDVTLKPSHPILKVAQAEGKQQKAFIKHFDQPKDWELPGWIQQRGKNKEGEIDRGAANLLARLVGSDMRLLDQEIDKLLLYADGRPVTEQDVQLLVSLARQAVIFDLVDCVGRRETDRALGLLHRLLDDGAEPLYLLAMLARQVRILIQVSELQAERLSPEETAKRLKLHAFAAKKGIAQARNFDLPQLEESHRRLVETDWQIKTGEMEPILALDMLVVSLTRV